MAELQQGLTDLGSLNQGAGLLFATSLERSGATLKQVVVIERPFAFQDEILDRMGATQADGRAAQIAAIIGGTSGGLVFMGCVGTSAFLYMMRKARAKQLREAKLKRHLAIEQRQKDLATERARQAALEFGGRPGNKSTI